MDTFAVPADLLTQPSLLVSTGGVILACNVAFASSIGTTPEALRGRDLVSLVAETDRGLLEYLRACAHGEAPPARLTFSYDGGMAVYSARGMPHSLSESPAPRPILLLLNRLDPGVAEPTSADSNADATQDRRAEGSLRGTGNVLDVTLASIGDGVIVTDAAGHVTFLNPTAEQLTGWSSTEARNAPFAEVFRIVNEYTGAPVDHPVAKVIKSGGIVGLANHTVLISRDGRRIPIDDSGAPIRHEGALVGIVIVFRDVTERRRAERERARLAAIVEGSDDAIASKTLDGIVSSWNPAAARLFGYEPEEIIGKSIRLIIPPELQAEEDAILDQLRRGQRVDHFETERLAKDGTRIDVSLTISPVRDPSGAIVGASKIARDITARRRSEKRLREEIQVRELLGDAAQAVVGAQLDLERVVQVITDIAREITGAAFGAFFYNVQDEGGESYRLYTISGAPLEAFSRFPQPRNTAVFGPTFRGEASVRSADITADPRYGHNPPYHGMPDGHLPVRSYLAVPVKAASGEVLGGLFFGHPEPGVFTERAEQLVAAVAAQAAVAVESARAHQALKREIDQRKQAEEALSQINRQKDEFLAMLAHELRNPLAPIRNATELLSHMLANDTDAQVALGMIKRQGQQLSRLVDDLLDVSRITTGRIQLKYRTIDLATIIAQAVETVEPHIREKRHRVSITAFYEPLYVEGDFARLVQCVGNILANATKYTEPGGEIWIRTRGDKDSAFIEISDTGTGIAPELLPHVFDLFVQSDRTLDRAQGGLGVGLAVVKRLAEMHKGEVTARSDGPGQGSTFEMRLPRIARPAPIPAVGERLEVEPRRVLIVDDNKDAADSLALLLTFEGHETHVVYSGKEALASMESFKPDVALLDIGLPEMNGYDLAREIRKMPQAKTLRLVALTGYGQIEDQQRARAAGFDGHLVKPVGLSALEEAIAGRPPAGGPGE
ncbi:MAG TPA: PAS domain S-box protein [Rhodanobacteraceae bacterium]|nr:PAS domain S-box protein [Rhodanobacteraceae bacterium]